MPHSWAELRGGMGKGFCSSCPPFPWSPGNEDKASSLGGEQSHLWKPPVQSPSHDLCLRHNRSLPLVCCHPSGLDLLRNRPQLALPREAALGSTSSGRSYLS